MTMITESIAILAITMCMIFLMIRGKRADYAISVTPLLLIPAVHLIAGFCMRATDRWIPQMPYQIAISLVDIIALAISCALIVTCAAKIKRVKTKRLYITLLVGYSVLLSCIYVYNTLQPLMQVYLQSLE